MNRKLAVSEKYALSINEASQYFGIGIKKMRLLAEEHLGTFSALSGNRYLIIRAEFEEYLRHLGAEPCYVSYDKLPEAVGNSLVDVQENPYQNFYDMHLYRKHKNLLELNMTLDSCVCLASVRFIEQLGPAGQEAFSLSLRETVRWFARNFYELTAAAKEGILREETIHGSWRSLPGPAEKPCPGACGAFPLQPCWE